MADASCCDIIMSGFRTSPDSETLHSRYRKVLQTNGFHMGSSVFGRRRSTLPLRRRPGVQYSVDMTRFVLDYASTRYGIASGKILDAQGNVLRQFNEPADELHRVPSASKVDAVAKAICTVNDAVPHP